MAGIGIVLNPHSRSNRKNPERAHRLGFIVGDKGSCHITDEISQVEALARLFKERDIEILGISGGDGTYHHTLTTFIKIYGATALPKICFLRGGTINLLSNNVGVKGTPEAILSRLIYQYHQDLPFRTVPISTVQINGHYGFVFAMGFIPNYICAYHDKKSPSYWDALFLMLKGIIHSLLNTRWAGELAKRFDAQVTMNGKKWPFSNYVEILGSTMSSLGFGLKPFYRMKEEQGKFQVIGMSMPPRSIIFHFPAFMSGKPIHSEQLVEMTGSSLSVEFSEPHSYFMDGESYDPVKRLDVSAGPILQVIVP